MYVGFVESQDDHSGRHIYTGRKYCHCSHNVFDWQKQLLNGNFNFAFWGKELCNPTEKGDNSDNFQSLLIILTHAVEQNLLSFERCLTKQSLPWWGMVQPYVILLSSQLLMNLWHSQEKKCKIFYFGESTAVIMTCGDDWSAKTYRSVHTVRI